MANHPAVQLVIDRIVSDSIGGAADTAKELMAAIANLTADSQASSLDELFAEVDAAALALLKICPSFAPPINVLHMMMGTIEDDMKMGTSIVDAKRHLAEAKESFDTFMAQIKLICCKLIWDGKIPFLTVQFFYQKPDSNC